MRDFVDREFQIPDGEIETETFFSGGKGGQNVNKVETGVRVTHIPTGIAVRCTKERSQMLNRELAMNALKEKLIVIMQEQQTKDLAAIRQAFFTMCIYEKKKKNINILVRQKGCQRQTHS